MRPDVRVQQRQGGCRVFRRDRHQVEFSVQPRLWRSVESDAAQPATRVRRGVQAVVKRMGRNPQSPGGGAQEASDVQISTAAEEGSRAVSIRVMLVDDHRMLREALRTLPVSYTHLTLPTNREV